MKREIKYNIGDKVSTTHWKVWYVNMVEVYKNHIQYDVWLEDKYESFEEWQLSPWNNKITGFTLQNK